MTYIWQCFITVAGNWTASVTHLWMNCHLNEEVHRIQSARQYLVIVVALVVHQTIQIIPSEQLAPGYSSPTRQYCSKNYLGHSISWSAIGWLVYYRPCYWLSLTCCYEVLWYWRRSMFSFSFCFQTTHSRPLLSLLIGRCRATILFLHVKRLVAPFDILLTGVCIIIPR